MNIEKLPSGNYRIRQQIDGQRISITLPYKPGKKEAYQLIQDKLSGKNNLKKTFAQCLVEMIDGKRHVISPSTIRSYKSMGGKIPASFGNKPIGSITQWDVQKYIDQLAASGKSPKTIRNYHGLISDVFATFRPDMSLCTVLPQKVRKDVYMPSDDDVAKILDEAKGTMFEIPLRLACYGLRRSEICALTPEDVIGNIVTINKAMVKDDQKQWVIKVTKTESSTRTVIIDSDLADLIRSSGVVYSGNPDSIWQHLQRIQSRLGIPNFPLHNLRHYYASTMHDLGVPDAAIMAAGGWKTDHIMKNIYRHAKQTDDYQQIMAAHMGNFRGQI